MMLFLKITKVHLTAFTTPFTFLFCCCPLFLLSMLPILKINRDKPLNHHNPVEAHSTKLSERGLKPISYPQDQPGLVWRVVGVPRLLDAFRAHYFEVAAPPDSLRAAYGGKLTSEELRGIRRGLLDVVGLLLRAATLQASQGGGPGFTAEEVQVRKCPA